MNRKLTILFLVLGISGFCRAQGLYGEAPAATYTPASAFSAQTPPAFALRTNLLYWGLSFTTPAVTPNLGLEVGTSRNTTINLTGSYNPWNLKGTRNNNKKMVHLLVQPEFRLWFCERFNGSSIGLHGIFAMYNVGGYDVISPIDYFFNANKEFKNLFNKNSRYEGYAYGGGVSYNYHWMAAKNLGVEFTFGFGYAYMQYKRCLAGNCQPEVQGSPFVRHYVGPTKAGVNLIFVL